MFACLPVQLEAEVVSLQHDQAQAAAKLQVSEEELVAARDQLLAARQALTTAELPEAGLLAEVRYRVVDVVDVKLLYATDC